MALNIDSFTPFAKLIEDTRYICVEGSWHALPCLLCSGVRAECTHFCMLLLFHYLASWEALQSRESSATTVSCCLSSFSLTTLGQYMTEKQGLSPEFRQKCIFTKIQNKKMCFTLGFVYIWSDIYGIQTICGILKVLPLSMCRVWLNF